MWAGKVSSGVVPLYSRLLMRTPSTSQRISFVRDPWREAVT